MHICQCYLLYTAAGNDTYIATSLKRCPWPAQCAFAQRQHGNDRHIAAVCVHIWRQHACCCVHRVMQRRLLAEAQQSQAHDVQQTVLKHRQCILTLVPHWFMLFAAAGAVKSLAPPFVRNLSYSRPGHDHSMCEHGSTGSLPKALRARNSSFVLDLQPHSRPWPSSAPVYGFRTQLKRPAGKLQYCRLRAGIAWPSAGVVSVVMRQQNMLATSSMGHPYARVHSPKCPAVVAVDAHAAASHTGQAATGMHVQQLDCQWHLS